MSPMEVYYKSVNIYNAIFGGIPNLIEYNRKVYSSEFLSFMDVTCKGYEKRRFKSTYEDNTSAYNFTYVNIKNKVLIMVKTSDGNSQYTDVQICFENNNKHVDGIIKTIEANLPEKSKFKGRLSFITKDNYGFKLRESNIDETHYIDDYYADDFKVIDALIKDKLMNTKKGIVLLHGEPGTGKTSYIRHLISFLNKRIIYLPSNLTQSISDPSFLNFLEGYKNSILVLEDSESVLKSRVGHNDNTVANLLNITDGLLGDCLNIQIIATFNANLKEIDQALMRKGRMIAKYEFKKLNTKKTNKILKARGIDFKSEKEMTLSEILNYSDTAFTKEKNKIGFVISN